MRSSFASKFPNGKGPLRVLVACEYSGAVRDSFASRGWDAMSCDLLPSDVGGPHYTGNVFDVINDGWDLLIGHPPCTYLSSSGLHWNGRVEGRAAKTEAGLQFVAALWNAPVPYIALENPVGCINTRLPFMPKPQYIQPHQFGHDASKRTGLWLKNLPHLIPTQHVAPRMVDGKPRWANQTDSGQNRLAPSPDRWKIRSETYAGIADAMADQWTDAILRDLAKVAA